KIAPEIFRRLGADVTAIATTPDGENINAGVGSTHLEPLIALMAEGNHDLGFAFDGDGDRVLAVDRDGKVVDGDELIALIARHDELRLPPGHAAAGRRGGGHRRGRPLRPGGATHEEVAAGGRAVRPYHRPGLLPVG